MIDNNRISKSNQEVAVAAWINYLNEIRINEMLASLKIQDQNLLLALKEMKWSEVKIDETIISNRGGDLGIHGYIAEILETGVNNSLRLINNQPPNIEWCNDNGAIDLIRDGTGIQQKFYLSDGLFSLNAAQKHLKQYPDFIKNGSKYQIPKDQFEKVIFLISLNEKEAYAKLNLTSNPTIAQWRKVHAFFKRSELKIEDFEPSLLRYDEVQKNKVKDTLITKKNDLRSISETNKNLIYQKGKPSLAEGGKTTILSSAIEGTTTLLIEISKRKKDKKISEFTSNDWVEIIEKSGLGFVKGGVRGSAIYLLTNVAKTQAFVANTMVTASFSIAEQLHLYKNGSISELELIESSQLLCLESTISALSSLLGQLAIPIPLIGPIIGNTVGNVLYQISTNYFDSKERQLLDEILIKHEIINKKLSEDYKQYTELLNTNMNSYLSIINKAFVPDIKQSFEASILLSNHLGLNSDEILHNLEEIETFFAS